MTQHNVNKYHIWYPYSCSICILYNMYNNNSNDNKCGAIYSLYYMYVCTYSKTPMPTYPRTDRLAGQSKRGQCSVHIHHATHSTS